MVYIYALMSGQLVLYVGKTKQFKIRERVHRNRKSTCASRYIPDYTDWTMKVLEETTDALGPQREQYFYDSLKPLYNELRPGQTHTEYRQTDAYKSITKAYKQTDAYKITQKVTRQTESRKAYMKALEQTDARKEYKKAYRQRKKLKSVQD